MDVSDVGASTGCIRWMARDHLLDLESLLPFAITACTGPGGLGLGRSVGHLYIGHGWCDEAGLL